MNEALFDLLNASEELASHLAALSRASGFSLQLVAADSQGNAGARSAFFSDLCPVTSARNAGPPERAGLRAILAETQANYGGPRSISCPCGLPCRLSHIACPVVMDGQLLATLVVGFLRRRPTRPGFQKMVRELRTCGLKLDVPRLERAYFGAPVLSETQYREAMILIEHFSTWLVDKCRGSANAKKLAASPQVEAVRSYVQTHLSERLSPAKIAEHLHVSPPHLCRLFKKKTGQTPTQYVNSLRIEEAKSLLGAPEAPVKSVAFATGFRSVPDFNRVFKKLTGMNPTGYRRSLASPSSPKRPSRESSRQ
jgi:AraC-like DNA-binding protein